MGKQKKDGTFYSFLLFLLLLGVCITGISEATVQLVPRVNTSGAILQGIANEDYVVFGKYEHRLNAFDGSKELTAVPIIWRVMSADAVIGGQKKAILLSHYLLESMAYEGSFDAYENRPVTSTPVNTWDSSEIQRWLNSSGIVSVYLGVDNVGADYFKAAEQNALLPYPDGTGSKMTLPSLSTQDGSSGGCDAGMGMYSFFLLLSAIVMKKIK